jgi:hypothetical protein
MIIRIIYTDLLAHLAKKQITVLTGMRRVGKTTALKFLLENIPTENKAYFDLEKVDHRYLFKQKLYADVERSLQVEGVDLTRKAFIALDEIQLVPEITSLIKYLYDTYDIKFLVTGSSSFYLKNHFTESLAGRKQVFEMEPFSFSEYLNYRGEKLLPAPQPFPRFNITIYSKFRAAYAEYLQWGGFPEVLQAGTEKEKLNYLKDIINSYIELDIKLLSDFTLSDELYKLLRLLSGRVGNKVDYSKISVLAGINRNRLKDYLNLLEYTYFIRLLPPFVQNADREIALQPKLYFTDNGLATVLGNVNTGALLENSLAIQLRPYGALRYYAKKTGQEIDFILNENSAIEVKETPYSYDVSRLRQRAGALGITDCHVVGMTMGEGSFQEFVWAGEV